MALMDFLSANILDTTTMVMIDSGTITVKFLFDRNTSTKYSTDGYNSDTSSVISIVLNETTSVSHILLLNHNLKKFSLF